MIRRYSHCCRLSLLPPFVRAREMLAYMARAYLQRMGLLSPEWPDWAVDTFVCLSLCCTLLVTAQWLSERRSYASGGDTAAAGKNGDSSSLATGPATASRFRG